MVELSEQVAAFDREIERTIRENGLDFEVLEGEERQEVVERLYGTFLSEKGRQARPGFVWGFLKYECDSIDCGGRDPYWSLPDVFDGDRVMYFCVSDFQDNDFLVFRARMAEIHTFVGDCECLGDDYCLMTEDGMELYCITHHDDLLHVDVRTSRLR